MPTVQTNHILESTVDVSHVLLRAGAIPFAARERHRAPEKLQKPLKAVTLTLFKVTSIGPGFIPLTPNLSRVF